MNFLSILLLTGTILVSGSDVASASRDESNINRSLANSYISQWLSIDISKSIDMDLQGVYPDEISHATPFEFISDDEQTVNGRIGFPAEDYTGHSRLALLVHPMGSDHDFWWDPQHSMQANSISLSLRQAGFTVISLDARNHGERARQGFGARDLFARARSEHPRLYLDTIIGSVRDYRQVLDWARDTYEPKTTLVAGYSMGAQISVLLSAYEPSIEHAILMVPPYVSSDNSPVAPRVHTSKLTSTNVLWLAAENDQFSTRQQTEYSYNLIESEDKTLRWFDSNHRLPLEYIQAAKSFIQSVSQREVSQ